MIGYYVHHHGSGHRHRAVAVARRLGDAATLLGSLGPPTAFGVPYVELPRDDQPPPDATGDLTAGGALHWAPLRHGGQQARHLALARWLAESDARLLVADVSVEAVLLARLLSVPPVAVALRGGRLDRAHATGYDAAVRILAPWPQETQHDWPERWLAKTTWTGMISRFDGRPRTPRECTTQGTCVVVLLGAGGHGLRDRHLADLAAVQDVHWHVLGGGLDRHEGVQVPGDGSRAHEPLDLPGPVIDPWPYLCRADVVVAAAGDAAIADVAAARAPLVAVPQDRPFDEQEEQVRVLAQRGWCVAAEPWPDRRTWPALLSAALELGGAAWSAACDGRGAQRAADELTALAGDRDAPRTSVA